MLCVVVMLSIMALITIPYSYVAPTSYIDTNIHGTLNVVQAARDLGVSKLFIHLPLKRMVLLSLYQLQRLTLLLGNLRMPQARLVLINGSELLEEL